MKPLDRFPYSSKNRRLAFSCGVYHKVWLALGLLYCCSQCLFLVTQYLYVCDKLPQAFESFMPVVEFMLGLVYLYGSRCVICFSDTAF